MTEATNDSTALVLKSQFSLGSFKKVWEENPDDVKRKVIDLTFLARTAEAAERFDDMCTCMCELVKNAKANKTELSIDERNLLSVAFKNVIGARRASWRTLNAESQDEKSSKLINSYKKQVETELKNICHRVIHLLRENLIDEVFIQDWNTYDRPKDENDETEDKKKELPKGEAQVFYLKMAGDYYRYLSEANTDTVTEKKEEGNQDNNNSHSYYKMAFELSKKVLLPTHPIRLGLALNYSVCFYEILKDKKKACELAKDAFDEAISKLDKLSEGDYKDSTLIMQLLRDNLTLWTSSQSDDNNHGTKDPEDQGGD